MTTIVRAKFYVTEIAQGQGDGKILRGSVVYAGSEENDKFFAATPGGQIEITTIKPELVDQFKPGDYFYAYIGKVS